MRSLRCIALLLAVAAAVPAQTASRWVYFDPNHHLQYRADERGNRIMDFSFAGYHAGGVRLPVLPVAKTLAPVEGDNTVRIQAAIDEVSRAKPDANGFRGAVLLAPGRFDVAGTIAIAASGVVLRGSGSGAGGSEMHLTGKPHRLLTIRGTGTWETEGDATAITDAYVASGATVIHVDHAAGFHVGDTVLVRRPVTETWVKFMGMDTLVRDGKPQTWIKAGTVIRTDRVIRAISGNAITLDVPLSDSIDAKLLSPPGASLVRYRFPGRIAEVGVENLRVTAPTRDAPIGEAQFTVLQMDAVIDGWARDIAIEETQNAVSIGSAAKRITIERVRLVHSTPHSGAAAPADFSLSGTQILVDRCSVSGQGTWPLVTQANVTGPNVVLHMNTDSRGVSPHQRWATGLLVDSSTFLNTTARAPGVAYSNRKTAGSGHGWDIGWAVAWNVTSTFLLIEQPPGAHNWCIGCTGEAVQAPAMGDFDAPGKVVTPASLYLEQLRERLGDKAITAIGY